MTMRPTDRRDEEEIPIFSQEVAYEIYLAGREDPVQAMAAFELPKRMLEEGKELESFMHIATNHVLQTIDVVREHRFMLSDARFNKFIAMTDHIQAISILAPEEETLMKALEDA